MTSSEGNAPRKSRRNAGARPASAAGKRGASQVPSGGATSQPAAGAAAQASPPTVEAFEAAVPKAQTAIPAPALAAPTVPAPAIPAPAVAVAPKVQPKAGAARAKPTSAPTKAAPVPTAQLAAPPPQPEAAQVPLASAAHTTPAPELPPAAQAGAATGPTDTGPRDAAGDTAMGGAAAPAADTPADAPAASQPLPEPEPAIEAAPQPAPKAAPTPEPEAASAAAEAPPRPAHDAEAPPRHALDGLAAISPMLPEAMARNIARIEELSQRLVTALAQRQPGSPGVQGPGPELFQQAAQGWLATMAAQPERIVQAQTSYWAQTLRLYANAQADLVAGRPAAPPDDAPADPRFRNPLWTSHPFFSLVRRQYQINAAALQRAAADLQPTDAAARRRIEWFTRQMIDMMAPTNFLATNPDALQRALDTEGESLVRGLENLVADVERGGGEVVVSLVDRDAFTVGENIATAPGTVVHRHPLFELIQYAPATEQVHQVPLILFPPWINKFYILDLKPQNSLIRWLVGQGHTLFVVSWRNPDGRRDSDVGMDDYVSAYLEAMDQVRARTGQPQVNAVGYCIGGTTLALTLALLKSRADTRVKAATFFTTLTDFSETGEFTTFLQDDFLGGIEDEVARTGVLGAKLMARTFSFLRANDLVWGPAIRSYMLGDTPPAFDLLYWNADATNLPGRMAREYLRGLCQSNGFATNGFSVLGTTVRLSDVDLPLCAIACEGDHIAPWLDCWRGFAMTGAQDRTFILSQSGHIAGIVNPPGRMKYGHYTSPAGFAGTAADWRAAAEFTPGSWWPTWGAWLAPFAGAMVPARHPGEGLCPAPGIYVHEPA